MTTGTDLYGYYCTLDDILHTSSHKFGSMGYPKQLSSRAQYKYSWSLTFPSSQRPLEQVRKPSTHISNNQHPTSTFPKLNLRENRNPHPTGTMRPKAPPTPSPSPSPSQPPRQPDHPSSSFIQFMDPNRPMPHPDYIFDANAVNPFTGKAALKGKVASTGQGGGSASDAVEEEDTDHEGGDENGKGNGHGKDMKKGEGDEKEENQDEDGTEAGSMKDDVEEEEEEEQEERDDEDKENWDKGPYITKSRLEVSEERNENGGRDFYLRRG